MDIPALTSHASAIGPRHNAPAALPIAAAAHPATTLPAQYLSSGLLAATPHASALNSAAARASGRGERKATPNPLHEPAPALRDGTAQTTVTGAVTGSHPMTSLPAELLTIIATYEEDIARFLPVLFKLLEISGGATSQNALSGALAEAMKHRSGLLNFVPEHLCTATVYRNAIAAEGWLLRRAPVALRNLDMYREAVRSDGMALRLVPYADRKGELLESAVEQNRESLKFVPYEQRTQTLALVAARSHERATVQSQPEALRSFSSDTPTWSDASAEYGPRYSGPGVRCLSKELVLLAVPQDFSAVEYLPEDMRTDEVLIAAICRNPSKVLGCEPRPRRTPEEDVIPITQALIDRCRTLFRNENVFKLALCQDGLALRFIKEEDRTEEQALLAVAQNSDALQFVPTKIRTDAVLYNAVRKGGNALRFLADKECSEALYRLAVQDLSLNLKLIASPLQRDKQLRLETVRSYGGWIYDLPKKKVDPDIFLAALESEQPCELNQRIPEHWWNKQACIVAFETQADRAKLSAMPAWLRQDQDVCIAAVRANPANIAAVPPHLQARTRTLCG